MYSLVLHAMETVTLHPGVQMSTGKLPGKPDKNLASILAMDWHSLRSSNTYSLVLHAMETGINSD